MDILAKMRSTAGNKTHESYYGAKFTWNNVTYPCATDNALGDPILLAGGQSPNLMITVNVRGELFDMTQPLPKKGQPCSLKPDPDTAIVYQMRIMNVTLTVGNSILSMVCGDLNQKV